MPKAVEAARRAVALAPSLAETHSALAMACLMGAWDKGGAEREFLRAFELNPRYIQARDWYALFYLQASEGRLAEGAAQAKLALKYDPLSAYANGLFGFTCSMAGRHVEGVQACERAVELDSESFLAQWCHHATLYLGGKFEEAVVAGELALEMSGRHPWVMGTLATTFADWGRRADAEALYAELMGRARRSYVPPSILALVAASAGIQGEAIRHAREAFAIRDPHCQFFFSRHWPPSARLYAYPSFCEMVAQHGPK
jgi:tetratricopeptide (TPR) repeat protein